MIWIQKLKNQRLYFSSPLFWAVLAAKLTCGSFFASHYPRDLFLPFIRYFIDSGFKDPWQEFLHRGILDAFPYSSVMLAVLSFPQAMAALLFGGAAHIPWPLQLLLLRLPMAAADAAIYLVLCRWLETKWRWVLLLYWGSPILFYINYVHGQIDAIPTAFLFLSLWFAMQERPATAGLWLAAGIASKFHLAAAIPLIGFYLFKKSPGKSGVVPASRYLLALSAGLALLIVPLLGSEGYRALVLNAKESQWVLALGYAMPHGVHVLICPTVLAMLILHFFSYEKITKDVVILYAGLVYTVLIVLVFPMPGWSYWSIPLLIYFIIRQNVIGYLPFWCYHLCYFLYFGLFGQGFGLISADRLALIPFGAGLRDFSFTFMQASLALTSVWVYRLGVKSYGRYKTRNKSVAIGIGGDSASGKHTLAEAISAILGQENVVRLHGDDYHRWPRQHEAWQTQTHLDPRSNYFRQPIEQIQALKTGSTIMRASYDHTSGLFSDPIPVIPRTFLLFEGLHPFVFERMREVFNIKIFLATEENLRRRWKVARDTRERGYSPEKVSQEIQKRFEDSERYVQPQAQFADWVIVYSPESDAGPESMEAEKSPLKVRHTVSSRIVEIEDLIDRLSAYREHLQVRWTMDEDLRHQIFDIQGELDREEVRKTAISLFPDLSDIISPRAEWSSGLQGINQLVLLTLLHHAVEP